MKNNKSKKYLRLRQHAPHNFWSRFKIFNWNWWKWCSFVFRAEKILTTEESTLFHKLLIKTSSEPISGQKHELQLKDFNYSEKKNLRRNLEVWTTEKRKEKIRCTLEYRWMTYKWSSFVFNSQFWHRNHNPRYNS